MRENGQSISESRARRASAPKSKNGCLTCKLRRVKCDETRPKCNTCSKSRRQCQWKPPPDESKKILDIVSQRSSQLRQLRPSQALPFIDEREVYYFWAYRDEVASELAGVIKTSPWTYTILQEAHTEPFVLRSIVALGALYKSFKVTRAASVYPVSMREVALDISAKHREFALAAYDKALKGMQRLASANPPGSAPSLRKVMIACLLVFCLEHFLDSPNTSTMQGEEGYLLLRRLESRKPHRAAGIASPDVNVVEDEIFHEFTRLDLRYAMFWGNRTLGVHAVRRHDGSETIKNMPARFGSLEEARLYQQLLMRRTFHLIGEAYVRIISAKVESGPAEIADTPGELVDPCSLPTMLFADRDAYLNDLRRWHKAFQPIFVTLITSKDPATTIAAALLRAQALGAEIGLAGAFFTEECDHDVFLPEAREIVSLAALIDKETARLQPNGQQIFNYLPGLHQPLHDVIAFCRDKKVRQAALPIFASQALRSPTDHMAKLVTRVKYLAELEEKSRNEDGKIPESARFRIIWVLHHYGDVPRGLTVIYARRIGYPLGRGYPAKREWKRRTFTADEASSMTFGEDPGYQPFPACLSTKPFVKPLSVKWQEVFDELRQRRHVIDA
ncbi:hypothetical protein M430DRAFT_15282 [Amorphotheca resinae ATCC 22711]|uniref:Zn(2)-C6 fungal-type domain-containing protein n=1 Tax=Amorphotheca resinae ATCC 22711 TaxID=857342 RepID=A0A2T3BFE0_AMORE|nr:hypothetical protein M430DRAFT_15282 [Amorphotheca resinae ATCC 22711]PSS28048.1 hypothetical protein M430DRAFT_15282 [Amorphotheca resinae ATCC 22711]